MKLLVAALIAISASAFASEQMGQEATEMFNVLTNSTAMDCMKSNLGGARLVNLSIAKDVYRCPGCTTYTFTGGLLMGDIVRGTKTIKMVGSGRRFGPMFVQTFTCEAN